MTEMPLFFWYVKQKNPSCFYKHFSNTEKLTAVVMDILLNTKNPPSLSEGPMFLQNLYIADTAQTTGLSSVRARSSVVGLD